MRAAGSAALAVVAPLVLLAAAFASLSAAQPWKPTPRVLDLDAKLASGPSDIVVLGSSFGFTDTHPPSLAAGLGQPQLSTKVLTVPGSSSPVWYATLKGRVIDAGLRPRLVLVVANMGALMQGRVDDAGQALLAEQLAAPDSALATKAGMIAPNDLWAALYRQRGRLRDAWRDGFRGGGVAALFGDAALADEAAETLFAKQTTQGMDVSARVLPGIDRAAALAEDVNLGVGLEVPTATFLPELAAAAHSIGAELVVALPPTQSSHPAGQRLSAAGETAVVAWAREAGVGWVDLRDEVYPSTAFRDGRHMTRQGAVRFSTSLGAALLEINALEGPVQPPATPPSVTRSGATSWPALAATGQMQTGCQVRINVPHLPPLGAASLRSAGIAAQSPLRVWSGTDALEQALGRAAVIEGCSGRWVPSGKGFLVGLAAEGGGLPRLELAGDAVLPPAGGLPATAWVYPGGALTWAWKEPLGAGPHSVETWVTPVGEGFGGGDAEIVLSAGTSRVALEESHDGVWHARLDLPEGGGTEVQLSAGGAAPFVWVGALTILGGDRPVSLVRESPARTVAIFAAPPTYAAPAPSVAQVPMPPRAGMGRFQVGTVDAVGCLRWEVTEDGAALPSLRAPQVRPFRTGTKTLRAEDSVYYSSSDGTPVASNGRTYRLRYREDRRCGRAQWLLDGDQLDQTLDARALRGLLGPPRLLTLSAKSDTELTADTKVRVELRRGEELVLERVLDGAALHDGVDLPLDLPAPGWFSLRVKADPGSPDLLLDGTVSDGMPAAAAPSE